MPGLLRSGRAGLQLAKAASAMLKLYIGNKNYPFWSMRPWVLLKQAGIKAWMDGALLEDDFRDFEEPYRRSR